METLIALVIALAGGVILSAISSWILAWAASQKGGAKERVSASSLTEIDTILAKSRKNLEKADAAQLWSDVMNVVMTSRSEQRARAYLQEVAKKLGPRGEKLKIEGNRILEERAGREVIS